MKKALIVIILSGFLLLMFVAMGVGIRRHIEGTGSENWPTTDGVITRSELVSEMKSQSSGSTGIRTETMMFSAGISYTYTVDEMLLEGTRVTFGDFSSSDRTHALELLTRYGIGQNVAVYFDPEQPTASVLERTMGANWLFIFIPALFITIIIFQLIKMIRGS